MTNILLWQIDFIISCGTDYPSDDLGPIQHHKLNSGMADSIPSPLLEVKGQLHQTNCSHDHKIYSNHKNDEFVTNYYLGYT